LGQKTSLVKGGGRRSLPDQRRKTKISEAALVKGKNEGSVQPEGVEGNYRLLKKKQKNGNVGKYNYGGKKTGKGHVRSTSEQRPEKKESIDSRKFGGETKAMGPANQGITVSTPKG